MLTPGPPWIYKYRHILCTVVTIFFSAFVSDILAQPYVDPLQVRYTYAFRHAGTDATPFQHLWAGSDIPIALKPKTYLLLSPYYEKWRLDSASVKAIIPAVQSVTLPVGILFPFNKNPAWMMSINAIIRINAEKIDFASNSIQYGGVAFVSHEKKPGKKLRFGLYANSDFFGLFLIPLFGADWKADDRNTIFGLLPGRLTWEHRINNRLFYGSTFRAITNSYRLANAEYVRIDDNQLSIYLDAYVSKKICVTLEPGYGIFRKVRTGTEKRAYLTNRTWGDGPFIKLSAAYRIRL